MAGPRIKSSFKSIKTPSLSSGGSQGGMNALLTAIMAQNMVKENIGGASELIGQAKEAMPSGKFPVGSSINISKQPNVNIPLSQNLSLDESRAIGVADTVNKHIQYIDGLMNTMPRDKFVQSFQKATMRTGSEKGKIGPFPSTYGDALSQKINFTLKDMEDLLLRLRSGAQINTQEMTRLTSLLPSWSDVSDPSDTDYSVIRTKMYSFKSNLDEIRNRLMSGIQYDENGEKLQYNPAAWGEAVPEHPVMGTQKSPIPGMQQGQQQNQQVGKIRVKQIASGKTGMIPANKFDPNKYQRI